ncbi:unnamed protein product, partial [Rhizoctonia solani]
MGRLNSTPMPTSIQNWEAASALLADAVTNYLKFSTFLETSNLEPGGNPDDLVSRIDTSLQTLHKTLDQQLHHSRAALAKTRNRLASPIYCLPEETLCEIFLLSACGPNKYRRRFPPDAGEQVRTIYHRLYNLLGVCTAWRKIGLNHPKFWSIVPMVDSTYACWHSLSVDLSMHRSGVQNLHVVVDATHHSANFRIKDFHLLAEGSSRIQSLNIRSKHPEDFPFVLPVLFLQGVPENLSELALCYTGEENKVYRTSPENDLFAQRLAPLLPHFPKLMGSLRACRISNVPFEWKHITFSARLVELRIESIALAGDLAITAFMTALSSACQLRDLKLIRIEAFSDWGSTLPGSQLSLPRLQTVYLEELYFNVLELILQSIAPGSYHLTLNLSERIRQNLLADLHTEDVRTETIHQLLAQHAIKRLILADDVESWAIGKGLNNLLRSLPALTSLEIYFYKLDSRLFKALTPLSDRQDTPFPKLEVLEFRGSTIQGGIAGLPRLTTKHPIQCLVLGQSMFLPGSDEQVVRIDKKDKNVRWLKD